MDLKETGTIPAANVLVDDWFWLAGVLYRVDEARKRFIDQVEITAFSQDGRSSKIKLDVATTTPFTIYNQ